MDIQEPVLPGVGLRHEFTTRAGRQLGVVSYRTGRRDLLLYGPDDPDACREVIRLTQEEADALTDLLGAARLTGHLAGLQQQIEGPSRHPPPTSASRPVTPPWWLAPQPGSGRWPDSWTADRHAHLRLLPTSAGMSSATRSPPRRRRGCRPGTARRGHRGLARFSGEPVRPAGEQLHGSACPTSKSSEPASYLGRAPTFHPRAPAPLGDVGVPSASRLGRFGRRARECRSGGYSSHPCPAIVVGLADCLVAPMLAVTTACRRGRRRRCWSWRPRSA